MDSDMHGYNLMGIGTISLFILPKLYHRPHKYSNFGFLVKLLNIRIIDISINGLSTCG